MLTRVHHHGRLIALLALLLFASRVDAAGQDAPAAPPAPPVRYPYEFGTSSVPMLRNAQFFSAAGELTDRGIAAVLDATTGHIFEKRGAKGVLARIARLWIVDMPVASLAQVYNHEYGHITRDGGLQPHSVTIEHWPWPLPFAGPRLSSGGAAWSFSESLPFLSGIAGGSEASHVLADTITDRAYAADRASYFDIVLYVYGKLDPSAYAIAYSGPSRPITDPWMYAMDLAYVRSRPFSPWPEEPTALFGSIRTAAWLNLLDYALVGNVEGVIADYIVAGRPLVRPRWLKVGSVRIVPGFNYTPTPQGQQYRINCRVGGRSAIGNVYVRWTQSLRADSVDARASQLNEILARHGRRGPVEVPAVVPLLGAGGEWRWVGDRRIAPGIIADAWREIDKRFAGRVELGVTWRHPAFGQGRRVRVAAGGKSRGYLPGFPDGGGFYVMAALLADF